MPKPDDLDLDNPAKTSMPKIDPDPLLGRLDTMNFLLERIAAALEDIADVADGMAAGEEMDGEDPEKK